METLHGLFSKNNSWAEPLAAPRSPEGSFPSSGLGGGQAPRPVHRAHPGPQPAGGPLAPTPLLWGEEPFGNPSAPPPPWLKRRGLVPAAVASQASG